MHRRWKLVGALVLVLAAGCTPGSTEQTVEAPAAGEAAAGADETPAGEEATASAPAPSAEELSQDPIRISVGIDGSYAPFFLADQQGLFDDAGVNVEVVQFAQGGEGVDALIAGEIQLAGSAESTVLGKSTRSPLAGLAIYEQSGEYVKLVAAESVDGAAGIRRFGIVPGSIADYATRLVVEQEGIPADEVEFVQAGPPELPALLQQGDIDGFVLWEPWPTQAAEAGAQVLAGTGEYGYAYQQWLVSTPDWVDGHEAEAQAVLSALDQAVQMMEEDPQSAVDATTTVTGLPAEQVQIAVDEIDFAVRGFTEDDLDAYEGIVAFLVEQGIVETEPQVGEVVRTGFYEGA